MEKAAIKVPTAAPATPSFPVIVVVRSEIFVPISPVKPPKLALTVDMVVVRLVKAFLMVEIEVISLLPADMIGPTVAATRAPFTMNSCIPGDREFHPSTRSFITGTAISTISLMAGITASAMSAPRILSWFMTSTNSSLGSTMLLKVSFTDPSKSPRDDVKFSRSTLPLVTAL